MSSTRRAAAVAVLYVAIYGVIVCFANAQTDSPRAIYDKYLDTYGDSNPSSSSQPIDNYPAARFGLPDEQDENTQELNPDGTRRFLFSPTIQNTITNLNANQNKLQQGAGNLPTDGSPYNQGYDFINPETGDAEIDVRGQARRICFIIA